MIDVPMLHTLVTDYGELTVPESVATLLGEIGPNGEQHLLRWERVQCRLAGEAWARGQTHTITAEGLYASA